jgi:hypothetical protein
MLGNDRWRTLTELNNDIVFKSIVDLIVAPNQVRVWVLHTYQSHWKASFRYISFPRLVGTSINVQVSQLEQNEQKTYISTFPLLVAPIVCFF